MHNSEILEEYYFHQETERLRFRQLALNDLDDWTVFFDNNEREHFLALGLNASPREKAREWIELQIERYQKGELGHLAIIEKKTGKLVGVSGLLVRNSASNLDYEVAYSVLPEFWGKGYATEAARKMKAFAASHKFHKRVVSWIHPENKFSQNVAKKNGMVFQRETIEFRGIIVEVWETRI